MTAYPYIPNALPEIQQRMLREIGLDSIDQLYDTIPQHIRFRDSLDLPPAIRSEADLRAHIEGLLSDNRHAGQNLSFLGGGCARHYVPAVCDEIAQRGEYLTAYVGDPHISPGKYQALFEYQSMLGALTGMLVVTPPTYDGSGAAASSLAMAARITGRQRVLLLGAIGADRRSQFETFLSPTVNIDQVGWDLETGLISPTELQAKLGDDVAAVYFECPSYLGFIDSQARQLSTMAKASGALSVVYVDPISLGVLAAPRDYGADIVCGDLQSLGLHMNAGGGLAGFIATPDEERFVAENPAILISGAPKPGGQGWSFAWCTFDRTSYIKREDTQDYYGTTQWLWGIIAGVYMALMGPQGLAEVGETISQRAAYLRRLISAIDGVTVMASETPCFKEFVIRFDHSAVTVAEVNDRLRIQGIFGGKDLSGEFPELGQSALCCVTEQHNKKDLDRFAKALSEVIR
ncbi:MAG: aminomethyl-transferring glycine dehydrogenase subunit GcvPA [Pseudomonadota bacterium]|nr:aminomethyl-transferring glycine dehydrogenase subunit GcvPA [Pseudomonadota bacterium]